MRILGRSGQTEVRTVSKDSPHVSVRIPAVEFDVNITWLLKHLDKEKFFLSFIIDRSHKKCHTPRRNPEVDSALAQFSALGDWAE